MIIIGRMTALLTLTVMAAGLLFAGSSLPGRSGNSVGVNADSADDVSALYNDKCGKCHGKDGRSKTMVGKMKHARDFTDAGWQDSVSDEHLINSVTNGKEGMPAFGGKLTDPQIAALVTYIRTFKGATKDK